MSTDRNAVKDPESRGRGERGGQSNLDSVMALDWPLATTSVKEEVRVKS